MSHTIWSRCANVWNFFWWMNFFAWSFSLLYFPWMWTIFLFSFFWHAMWACGIPSLGMHLYYYYYYFLTCLLSMWHTFFGYASFISFFFIVHILDGHFREKESWYVMEFYFVSGWKCLLSVSGRVRDLDHENMTSL